MKLQLFRITIPKINPSVLGDKTNSLYVAAEDIGALVETYPDIVGLNKLDDGVFVIEPQKDATND